MDETMYESRESMPVYQSTDLEFDAARAEWERHLEENRSMHVIYPNRAHFWLHGECPTHGLFLIIGNADGARIDREWGEARADGGPYCPTCGGPSDIVFRSFRAEVRAGGETHALIEDEAGVRWVPLATAGLGLPEEKR